MESGMSETDTKIMTDNQKEEAMKRLPKRLAYILRYGALKEGLQVDEHGYVDLAALSCLNLLRDYSQEEIFTYITTSVSYRNIQRYNWKERDGNTFVRAAYLRNFEQNPYHSGTQVKTLFENSMTCILSHLEDYDLEDFPDENIIRLMIRRLKRQKKLTTKALKTLLVPTISRLDLEDVYLTNNVLRTIWTQCPDLKRVSLKGCGYIITDSMLDKFTKNLPLLEALNLCSCSHLTSRCLTILAKNLPNLTTLHVANISALTYESCLKFLQNTSKLTFLDIFYLKTNPEQHIEITKVAAEKGVNLILREPKASRSSADITVVKEEAEKDDDSSDHDIDGEQDSDGDYDSENEILAQLNAYVCVNGVS